jgi:hypothetical protein
MKDENYLILAEAISDVGFWSWWAEKVWRSGQGM